MTHRLSVSLALVSVLAFPGSRVGHANATFDFHTGQGRVERSEVQSAFGLNNGQMQKRASQVSFRAVETHKIAVLCDSGATREAVMEQTATADWALSPDKANFDFFQLRGLSDILIADPAPATQICGGPGHFGATTEITRTLSVQLGGTSIVLLEDH